MRKTVAGDTTRYVLDLAPTLPVVISDTEAVYLYGLDIIARQQSQTLYYVRDGLGSVRSNPPPPQCSPMHHRGGGGRNCHLESPLP
jgi:hypothetical protein